MGVLGALYLPLCRDEAFKAQLKNSLARYAAFVARELEDDSGIVYGSIGRTKPERLYNYSWAAHFHLAMYRATGDSAQLNRFVRLSDSGNISQARPSTPLSNGLLPSSHVKDDLPAQILFFDSFAYIVSPHRIGALCSASCGREVDDQRT